MTKYQFVAIIFALLAINEKSEIIKILFMLLSVSNALLAFWSFEK